MDVLEKRNRSPSRRLRRKTSTPEALVTESTVREAVGAVPETRTLHARAREGTPHTGQQPYPGSSSDKPDANSKRKDVIGSRVSSRTRSHIGIVTGFGDERTDDLLGDSAIREQQALHRARRRSDDGTRGRVRDFADNDLDRSIGGPWQAGRQ